jgi:hypothetical protein
LFSRRVVQTISSLFGQGYKDLNPGTLAGYGLNIQNTIDELSAVV